MSYLRFTLCPPPSPRKTLIWVVESATGGGQLGMIGWYPHWRKYTFNPGHGTTFDPACLREIADFVEEKTREHRG